jgi:RNA polymerase sigma-70 factor, ECF subfamily
MRRGEDEQRPHCAAAGILYRLGRVPGTTGSEARGEGAMRGAEETSDEALMVAYREGDAGAFQLLYGRHRNGLYRFLLRQCGAAAIAEELFQDVWLNLIRARSRYAPEARFATYLYRIAHNRLIDHFRRVSHRPQTQGNDDETDLVAELPADCRQQPEARVESRARIERFMALLQSLPEAQREAFVMHEEAGLSVEEIARATGVNSETAKSRLRYALAKLRRGLEEWM